MYLQEPDEPDDDEGEDSMMVEDESSRMSTMSSSSTSSARKKKKEEKAARLENIFKFKKGLYVFKYEVRNKNQDKIKDSEILMFINNNVCQPFNTFLGQVRRRRRSMLKVMTRMMIRY